MSEPELQMGFSCSTPPLLMYMYRSPALDREALPCAPGLVFHIRKNPPAHKVQGI